MFRISEPSACNAYYHPLLSNFLNIFRSSDDERRMKEEGDLNVEVEVDEKR